MLRRNVTALFALTSAVASALAVAGCAPPASIATSDRLAPSAKEQAYLHRLQADVPAPVTVRVYSDGLITWQGVAVTPEQLDLLFVRASQSPGLKVRVTPQGADPRRVAAVMALARSRHVVAGLYDGA